MDKLPEKWCVIVDDLNREILYNWAEFKEIKKEKLKAYSMYVNYNKKYGFVNSSAYKNNKVISTEEFRKLVLNESNELPKDFDYDSWYNELIKNFE